jgi:tetratricopeptide (TPR) repeat protein
MSLRKLIKFFTARSLLEQVAAGLILAIILGIWGLWWYLKPKSEPPVVVIEHGPNSVSQTGVGDNVNQVLKIDKSRSPSGGIYIERVESGATVNINVIDYQDGVSQAEKSEVRELFREARAHYDKKEFGKAIEYFTRCLDLEEDNEKRGALNLQIGNCYYELQKYIKAAEFYAAGLRESRKAKDSQGEASNLSSIANTYMLRPASSGEVRGENVRKAIEFYAAGLRESRKAKDSHGEASNLLSIANTYMLRPASSGEVRGENVCKAIECYKAALEIYKRDEYPVDYAMTQNNLGTAYADLPSATPEERGENVRKAVECYKAAMEIYKKDEYPVDYAMTQSNLGNAYTDLPSVTAEQRAENVRKAIECCKAALEIYKKDEYPQYYCQTAKNLGLALASIDNPDACYWLKEAYALREYLEDQGKGLEEVIQRICKEERK